MAPSQLNPALDNALLTGGISATNTSGLPTASMSSNPAANPNTVNVVSAAVADGRAWGEIAYQQTVIFGETLPAIKHEQFEGPYCWVHSKIMPYRPNATLGRGFEVGDPLEPFDTVGTHHAAAWYTQGSILKGGAAGHYLRTGGSRLPLLEALEREVGELIMQLYHYPEPNTANSD